MSKEALLEARNISKTFGKHQVLDDVSLSVNPKQIVTLIGPNGAGKTTLVRIALALISADEGSVVKKPKLRLGYMPQKLYIESTLPLTVKRFLLLGQKVLRKEINEIEKNYQGCRSIIFTISKLQVCLVENYNAYCLLVLFCVILSY